MSLPNENDILIKGSFGDRGVATINWSYGINKDDPFRFLIDGYKEAFLKLTNNLTTEIELDNLAANDIVYPILFCLRHYIELSLKDTIRKYKMGLDEVASDEIGFEPQHELVPLFTEMKKYVKKIPPTYMGEIMVEGFDVSIEITEKLIEQLTIYDEKSFAFRYPYNRGKPQTKIVFSLPELSIDINNLRIVGEKIFFILDCINMESETFCSEEQIKKMKLFE